MKEANGNKQSYSKPTWGRYSGSDYITTFILSSIFSLVPFLTFYCHLSCAHYDCAMSVPIIQLINGQITLYELCKLIPAPTFGAFCIFAVWYIFQALLFLYLPGTISNGQMTPAGHTLKYNVNGLRAWIVSHILFLFCVYFEIFPATIIYDNWGPLLTISNVWGYLFAVFVYIKATYFPTHPEDVKFTGNLLYDFFMGCELNPRIGNFDFKLFFNGRPGIVGWNLINLSFLAAQYRIHHEITNSIILLLVLQMIYILDFFWNEEWYLSTIDIAHDHFGWYLSWGDSVWLPFMYTLQGYYLTVHPYNMSNIEFMLVLLLGVTGYAIFRACNYQKLVFRKTAPGETCIIWGKPATYIVAPYKTCDGKIHQSKLLTSGFWGISRHFNYFGDLCIAFAYCACCGFNHLLPYFYIIYMTSLLVGRVERDYGRLKDKYGPKWDEYCHTVKWKILPYIY